MFYPILYKGLLCRGPGTYPPWILRGSVVKFWGSQSLYEDFSLCKALLFLTLVLFEGQLYPVIISNSCYVYLDGKQARNTIVASLFIGILITG